MVDVLTYGGELARAMAYLASFERTVFIGQAVRYPGQAAFGTFADVPMDKRVEMPVAENFQTGVAIGLALAGFVPVSFYPRMDFLICACDQLVNHLDKARSMGWQAKVILRTAVGRHKHFSLGPQHTQDHTEALRLLLPSVRIVRLTDASDIVPAYKHAMARDGSTLLVENMDYA